MLHLHMMQLMQAQQMAFNGLNKQVPLFKFKNATMIMKLHYSPSKKFVPDPQEHCSLSRPCAPDSVNLIPILTAVSARDVM